MMFEVFLHDFQCVFFFMNYFRIVSELVSMCCWIISEIFTMFFLELMPNYLRIIPAFFWSISMLLFAILFWINSGVFFPHYFQVFLHDFQCVFFRNYFQIVCELVSICCWIISEIFTMFFLELMPNYLRIIPAFFWSISMLLFAILFWINSGVFFPHYFQIICALFPNYVRIISSLFPQYFRIIFTLFGART